MKVYTEHCDCSICGGEGLARPRDSYGIWTNGMVHCDPSVCRDILAQKARKLKQKEEELKKGVIT